MPVEPIQQAPNMVPLRPGAPVGTTESVEADGINFISLPERMGPTERVARRFMGTDVDDPLRGSRMVSTVIGGALGAQAGSKIPFRNIAVNPATGALFFGTAGLVAGAVAPEATLELGEAVGLLPAGTRDKAGLTPRELMAVAEGEALLDIYTLGGLSAMRMVGRGLGGAFAGVDRAGRQLAETAAQQRIALLPVQVGNSVIGRGFVSIFGHFPIIAGPIRRTAQEAENAIASLVDGLPTRFGAVAQWNEVSEQIYRDARTLVDDVNTHFDVQYKDLWDAADDAGVQVLPEATVRRAQDLLKQLDGLAQVGVEGEDLGVGPVLERVRRFLERDVARMGGAAEGVPASASVAVAGDQAFRLQSLRQMDALLSKIDQEISSFEPGQRKFAMELFSDLKRAVQLDVVTNFRGEGAEEVINRMRALDEEFSGTISQLFETATANRFASVRRKGLRGSVAAEATRIPVDSLARIVMNLDSPNSVRELARIVEPETMRRIVGSALSDIVQGSMKRDLVQNTQQFDPVSFARLIGLSKETASRREALDFMLKETGHPMSVDDLASIAEIGERIASLPVPNVSTFVARRGVLGGIGSIVAGLLPGLALAGGGFASGGVVGSLIGIAIFAGGGRLAAKMISDPLVARSVKTVMSEETSKTGRRLAFVQALRLGLVGLHNDGELTAEELQNTMLGMRDLLNMFDRQLEQMGQEVPE